jgi:hypothetical protein
VVGAYVQTPTPTIVGLEDKTVISSNDAASLYPISGAHQNLGYDTLRDRIYDVNMVKQILGLIEMVFQKRDTVPNIADQALNGFTSALRNSVLDYFKRGKSKGLNKKDAMAFTIKYYPILLKRILNYPGKLEDIFTPKDDKTYYLLKSCLYPILETIFWLSPQNKGYNQTAVDYVLFNNEYVSNKREYYIFTEINSTKTRFKKMAFLEGIEHFKTRIINPYGVLYDLHDINLSYDVEITLESLDLRSEVKGQMLVLNAIASQVSNLSENTINFFNHNGEHKLTREQANQILDDINDPENREWRIGALTEITFPGNLNQVNLFIALRAAQLDIVQLGIKVSMNSGYGIFAMATWVFANSLIGNSFTCAGKIFGIKLFQKISVDVITERQSGSPDQT